MYIAFSMLSRLSSLMDNSNLDFLVILRTFTSLLWGAGKRGEPDYPSLERAVN